MSQPALPPLYQSLPKTPDLHHLIHSTVQMLATIQMLAIVHGSCLILKTLHCILLPAILIGV
jgi:hypothetical protein